jgi:hypothetical protein
MAALRRYMLLCFVVTWLGALTILAPGFDADLSKH